jgi:hypothetical protein
MVLFILDAVVAYGDKSPLVFVPWTPPEDSRAHISKQLYTHREYIRMMAELHGSMRHVLSKGKYSLVNDSAKEHTTKASKHSTSDIGLHMLHDFPHNHGRLIKCRVCGGDWWEGHVCGRAYIRHMVWCHHAWMAWTWAGHHC